MATKPRSPKPEGAYEDLGVVDALVQLSFKVQEVLGKVADGHDLSLVQVRLLGILRDREPGMFELATFLGLDKSSVTGLVTRAERRGFVRRSGRADDRRAVHVALTAVGQRLAGVVEKQVGRELAKLVAGLDHVETDQLASLASRVVSRFASPSSSTP
ncbi:MAG: MarR family winged helix-turn-helix transcriptional regulator [Polyangiaceae bacterium]|jgi:MarR family transcriptional regulator, lower aerobic nicotinate degradation pathway regulator